MPGDAIVVGAGIGGLAAAIALRDAGWEVEVLERADGLAREGAGLSVWPNGVRALRALGLDRLVDRAPRVDGSIRRSGGAPLTTIASKELERRFGEPLVALARPELLDALLDRAGADRVRFGAEVDGIDEGELVLTGGERRTAELIVGADGLRSAIRAELLGDGEPRDSGLIAFRGLASFAGELPAGEWWGPGVVAGLVPLGGGRVYWYVSFHGPAAEVGTRLDPFGEPVARLVGSTPSEEVLRHELFDRDPARRIVGEGVALLGDAAHPMLPFLGQGACSALEDAVALGQAAQLPSVDAALARYDERRAPAGARLIRESRRAARIALVGPGPMRALRNGLVDLLPPSIQLRRLAPILSAPA